MTNNANCWLCDRYFYYVFLVCGYHICFSFLLHSAEIVLYYFCTILGGFQVYTFKNCVSKMCFVLRSNVYRFSIFFAARAQQSSADMKSFQSSILAASRIRLFQINLDIRFIEKIGYGTHVVIFLQCLLFECLFKSFSIILFPLSFILFYSHGLLEFKI